MKVYKAIGRHCNNISYNIDYSIKQRQMLETNMVTVKKSNKRLRNPIIIVIYSY